MEKAHLISVIDLSSFQKNKYMLIKKKFLSMRAKVLIQIDPKQPQKWSDPIVCEVVFYCGSYSINFQKDSFLSIYSVTHSTSVKTDVNNKSLATHTIQPEYKLKDSSSDYFKLPYSLHLDENYVYQRYMITRTKDITRSYYLENHEQHLLV